MSAAPRSPLAGPLFRRLWLAGLVSNLALWMQNVGAASAGLLIAAQGPQAVFLLNALSFALVIGALTSMSSHHAQPPCWPRPGAHCMAHPVGRLACPVTATARQLSKNLDNWHHKSTQVCRFKP